MLLTTLVVAIGLGCLISFGIYSNGRVLTPVGAALGIWIIITSLVDPIDRLRRRLSLPRAVVGMTIAHIGIGVFVLALTTVESFTLEHDVSLARGGTASVGAYEFRFDGVKPVEGPQLRTASVAPSRSPATARPLTILYPEKRQYWVQHSVTTEAAIEMHYGSKPARRARRRFSAPGSGVSASRYAR